MNVEWSTRTTVINQSIAIDILGAPALLGPDSVQGQSVSEIAALSQRQTGPL